MDETSIVQNAPENTLEFWEKARNGNKRDFIFDYGVSMKCSHAHLLEMVQGANWYRCEDCNYCFFIMTAYQQPLHSVVLEGLQNALHFSKEFGMAALQEVVRRPTGQYDGKEHKPLLPEGLDLIGALEALEEVNVNTEDHGEQQLRTVQNAVWNGRGFLTDGRSRCQAPRRNHMFKGQDRCTICSEPKGITEGVRDDSRKSLT
jgi:hypothetical protein|tara:strand:- start:189 stop:797 length:609 start_codon:yes stop_codon:yes gene_type:complete